MRTLGLPLSAEATRPPLAPALAALVAEGFATVDGCLVLRRFVSSARRTSVQACHDETGFEAFVNHIHVEDWLDEPVTGVTARDQTAAFVLQLAEALTAAHPDTQFAVLIAASSGGSWSVRFHRVRPDQMWIADDVETYRDEAVMLVMVGST